MPIHFDFSKDIESKLFKQIDFALVRTCTNAAYAAQKAIRDSLSQNKFVLRNNFVFNSIKVEKATKADPTAAVYVPTDGKYNADFLVRQELGGLKTPSNGGKHLALPPPFIKGARRPILRVGKRPSDLLKIAAHSSLKTGRVVQGYFKIDEETPARYRHGLPFGIYQRGGGGKGNKGKRRLKMKFAFEKQADVDARFEFRETCMKAAQRALPSLFAEALSEALRTVR